MIRKLSNGMSRPRAVIVDLDGTILHRELAKFQVKGRSGVACFSKKSSELLLSISQIAPVIIATGRNASSVKKFTDQVPDIQFSGFILENGLVVRDSLYVGKNTSDKWRYVYDRVPAWESLTGYENCLGLIPPEQFRNPVDHIKKIVKDSGENWYIYPEKHKIFIYPQLPDKTKGLSSFNIDPFIALGNENNDLQMLSTCSIPVTLQDSSPQIKDLVTKKNGYCSLQSSHLGTEDMLTWVYNKLHSNDS
ncbi:HAD hydrolase family protein [Desulforhopalus vacuolatus]|uniref:HAD family hydrolase n=1 Tax=Desulforhopalus vacuolatus TaxID=40414 RepID=UPI0019622904|nr:HAD hydrolase family protein [Desulforhopalus vacuolatus]MBM9518289.1 HAD hydrolase family protein [Desulforhopalus vacuolatus]